LLSMHPDDPIADGLLDLGLTDCVLFFSKHLPSHPSVEGGKILGWCCRCHGRYRVPLSLFLSTVVASGLLSLPDVAPKIGRLVHAPGFNQG